MLKEDFGLETFATTQLLTQERREMSPYLSANERPSWCEPYGEDLRPRFPVVYLTLPSQRTKHGVNNAQSTSQASDAVSNSYTHFQLVDSSMLLLSDEKKRSFMRCMKLLHLTPRIIPALSPSVLDDLARTDETAYSSIRASLRDGVEVAYGDVYTKDMQKRMDGMLDLVLELIMTMC